MSNEAQPKIPSLYGKSGAIMAGGIGIYGAKKLGVDILGNENAALGDYIKAYGSLLGVFAVPFIRFFGLTLKDPSFWKSLGKALKEI